MQDQPYTPIDCDFHDELEAAATRKKVSVFVVLNDQGQEELVTDIITDLGHGDPDGPPGEFMTLKSGKRYRLDCIVRIDGKLRPV